MVAFSQKVRSCAQRADLTFGALERVREFLGGVRADRTGFVWPVVGACPEFDPDVGSEVGIPWRRAGIHDGWRVAEVDRLKVGVIIGKPESPRPVR